MLTRRLQGCGVLLLVFLLSSASEATTLSRRQRAGTAAPQHALDQSQLHGRREVAPRRIRRSYSQERRRCRAWSHHHLHPSLQPSDPPPPRIRPEHSERTRSVDRRARGSQPPHEEAPRSTVAREEASRQQNPHRRHLRLHDAAGEEPTKPYTIYKQGSTDSPASRRRGGRRRRRNPQIAGVRGTISEETEEESKRRSLAGGLFCVAKPGADPTALQTGLNYACGPGHADCSAIQPGGKCYKPNDLPALASYAYNDYYQRNVASGASCNFSGTATTTATDPSSGQCVFAGSSMAGGSNSSTPGASAPSSFVPPSSTFTPTFGGPASSFTPLEDAADSLMAGARRALCVLLLLLPLFFF